MSHTSKEYCCLLSSFSSFHLTLILNVISTKPKFVPPLCSYVLISGDTVVFSSPSTINTKIHINYKYLLFDSHCEIE